MKECLKAVNVNECINLALNDLSGTLRPISIMLLLILCIFAKFWKQHLIKQKGFNDIYLTTDERIPHHSFWSTFRLIHLSHPLQVL